MTILKIEVNTDDIGIDGNFDNYGATFEDLFISGLNSKIADLAFEKIVKSELKDFSDIVTDIIKSNVDQRILNLLNEDIKITGRWGEKTFFGSVEDYIKKEIDAKYLYPVNSSGKKLEGCSVGQENNTWINWYLEKQVSDSFARLLEKAQSRINNLVEEKVKKELDSYANSVIENKVKEKLIKIGVQL